MTLDVLVTGGGGYLGSVLCQELLGGGHRVTVIDDGSSAGPGLLSLLSNPAFTLHIVDFRSESTFRHLAQRADVVVHLAAVVGQPACDANPVGATSVNLDGVREVAESVPDGKMLIFASTSSVYGRAPSGVCDETTPPNPVSLYSELKLRAEELVLARPESIVVRPVTLYGSSGSMRLDLLAHQMIWEGLEGRAVSVYEPQRLRSFMHVRDASRALSELVASDSHLLTGQPSAARVVNLTDPMSHVSKRDLAVMIAEMLGCTVDLREGYTDPDERDYRVVSNSPLAPRVRNPMTLGDGLREVAMALRLLRLIRSVDGVR